MNSVDWYLEGKTEMINDYNVFFKRSGKGESLICIHGFPSSSWDFEAIWPSLTERFDVLIHDLIGLGKSAKPNQPLPISLQWVMPLVKAVVPIRLINGIEDPVSGKHAADSFNEVVPHADVVLLENCGHYPQVEAPKKY